MSATKTVAWTKQVNRAYDWDENDGSAYTYHDYWLKAANTLIQVTQTPKKQKVRVCVFAYIEKESSRIIEQISLLEEWLPTLDKAQKRGVQVAAGYLEEAAKGMRVAPFDEEKA